MTEPKLKFIGCDKEFFDIVEGMRARIAELEAAMSEWVSARSAVVSHDGHADIRVDTEFGAKFRRLSNAEAALAALARRPAP